MDSILQFATNWYWRLTRGLSVECLPYSIMRPIGALGSPRCLNSCYGAPSSDAAAVSRLVAMTYASSVVFEGPSHLLSVAYWHWKDRMTLCSHHRLRSSLRCRRLCWCNSPSPKPLISLISNGDSWVGLELALSICPALPASVALQQSIYVRRNIDCLHSKFWCCQKRRGEFGLSTTQPFVLERLMTASVSTSANQKSR